MCHLKLFRKKTGRQRNVISKHMIWAGARPINKLFWTRGFCLIFWHKAVYGGVGQRNSELRNQNFKQATILKSSEHKNGIKTRNPTGSLFCPAAFGKLDHSWIYFTGLLYGSQYNCLKRSELSGHKMQRAKTELSQGSPHSCYCLLWMG